MNIKQNPELLLSHLAAQINYQSEKNLQSIDLNFAQHKVLLAIHDGRSDQLQHLAAWLGQNKTSISRQIDTLKNNGLMKIQVNSKDRRRHVTSLTDKGRRLLKQSQKILSTQENQNFANLTKQQKQALIETLEEIHEVACKSKTCNSFFKPREG